MKIAFCVFVVQCLINISRVSSLQSPKSCEEFGALPMEGFIKEAYAGDWFVYELYDTPGSQKYECFVSIRTPRPDGNQDILQLLVKPNVLPDIRAAGVIVFDEPNEGHYKFLSNDIPSGEVTIIKTDYVNYAIEYNCQNLDGGGSDVKLLILSRTPVVTFFTQKQINDVLKAHGFNITALKTLHPLSCPSQLKGSVGLVAGLLKLVTDLLGGVLGILG